MIFSISNPATAGTMDWIGCGPEYTWSSWICLDWVSQLVDWFGLDLAKWTHVQLWYPSTTKRALYKSNPLTFG